MGSANEMWNGDWGIDKKCGMGIGEWRMRKREVFSGRDIFSVNSFLSWIFYLRTECGRFVAIAAWARQVFPVQTEIAHDKSRGV
jgi:hypothetical protein